MNWIVLLVAFTLLPGRVSADIFGWRDAQGVQHFTNVVEDVPAEFRGDTRVVARERGSLAPEENREIAAAPRQAQVVYDPTRLQQAYQEGVARGWREGQRAAPADERPVQVIAPVTIASVPIIPPYVPYIEPRCVGGFATTGFDHGRQRHRTWRLGFERCRSSFYPPTINTIDPRFLSERRVTRRSAPPPSRRRAW